MNPSWQPRQQAQSAAGLWTSFLGKSSLADWNLLNPQLMDIIYCTYKSSYVLQTVIDKLRRETLRGGVSLRYVSGKAEPGGPVDCPPDGTNSGLLGQMRTMINKGAHRRTKQTTKNGKNGKNGKNATATTETNTEEVQLTKSQHERTMRALNLAVLYGLLYGMVPVMVDPQYPDSIRVPPIGSGQFVGRMTTRGQIDVGWQWRDHDLNAQSAGSSPDVWVFVWEDREPDIGSSAPFRSVILPLLPELMRERELVEADTQAHYELSSPAFVVQENPRRDLEARNRQMLELVIDDYIHDPFGSTPGHGPGGTVTGQQREFYRADLGGAMRASKSRQRGNSGFAGQSERIQIDPCTGDVVLVDRLLSWQRGVYMAPTGWTPTAGFPRPALRSDLLAHREYVGHMIAAALGVPVSIAFEGSGFSRFSSGRNSSGRTGAGRGSNTLATSAMYQSQACDTMRDTIAAVRTELSAMFAQAHYVLLWKREALGLSKQVVLGERLIECDPDGSEAMARQLELVGDSLRFEWEVRRNKRLQETEALHRAAAIADQASKLWKDKVLKQSIATTMGIVAGVWDGSLGFPGDMSMEAQNDRESRGERLEPVPESVLRDPEDDGDVTRPPKQDLRPDAGCDGEGKEVQTDAVRRGRKPYRIDPNELAEYEPDRRQRIREEGWDVSDWTLLPRGDSSGRSGYQRRALTEELPPFEDAIEEAQKLVDARLAQITETERLRSRITSPATGTRGDTKVELVWRSPPMPDWSVLRELALDGVMNRHLFQTMFLSHLGFSPESTPGLVAGTDPFGLKAPRALLSAPRPNNTSNNNNNKTTKTKPNTKPKPKETPKETSDAAAKDSGKRARQETPRTTTRDTPERPRKRQKQSVTTADTAAKKKS